MPIKTPSLDALFASVVEKTNLVIYLKDVEGRYVFVNRQYEEVSTLKREQIVGKRDEDLHSPEVAALFREQDAQVVRARRPLSFEETIDLPGGPRSFVTEKVPLFDDSGAVVAVGGFCTEITAQLGRGETELTRVRELEQATLNAIQDIFYVIDRNGRFLLWNRALGEVTGYSEPEIAARGPLEYFAPEDAVRVAAAIEQVWKTGSAKVEASILTKGGERIPYEFTGTLAKDARGGTLGLSGTGRNLVERNRTRDALREANHRLAQKNRQFEILFDGVSDGILVADAKTRRFISANKAIERLLGYTQDELLRLGVDDIHPAAELARVKEAFEEQLKGSIFVAPEIPLLRKDGAVVYADVGASAVTIDGRPCLLGAFHDVTERRRMEESQRTMQQLESLGTLAGGIAHDFNNLLTIIGGNLSLLKADAEGDPEKADILRDVDSARRTAQGLARQLLTFASGGAPVLKTEELGEIVKQTARFATRGSSARCEFEGFDAPLHGDVDKGQLSQVVQNLVINASQAMPSGGVIRVGLAAVDLRAGEVPGLPPGRFVRIRVADEGRGIPKDALPRIFDPYFTTKSSNRGLGLAVCRSIVVRHAGHIGAVSDGEHGTTFTVHLPLASAPPEAERPARDESRPLAGGRYLVMDDEELVRLLVVRVMRRLGAEVSVVADGEGAIGAYRAALDAGAPFTAVIMDLTVSGGMGGIEAAKAIIALDPRARIVASSGYSNAPVLSDLKRHGFCAALNKPYEAQDIAKLLGSL